MKTSSRTWLGLASGIAFLAVPALAAPALAETPEILYAVRFGGSQADDGRGIAVDAAGNAYVTGTTLSSDLPVLGGTGHQPPLYPYTPVDAFVFKLDPAGRPVYSTYLDAPWSPIVNDMAEAVGVDAAGGAWVGGWIDGRPDEEAFLARLGPGSAWSFVYLAGENYERTLDTAVDPAGNAYVTGITNSFWFPGQKPNMVLGGRTDAFVVKVDPEGRVVYVTLLGGNGSTAYPFKMAVDPAGQVYLTGETEADLRVVHAAQSTFGGGAADAFVAKLDASGDLVYSTYLGGSAIDFGRSLAVDASGDAYVAVVSFSGDFPVTSPLAQPADLVVAKLDPSGALVASRHFQGTGLTAFAGLALDGSGSPYLARSSAGLVPAGNGPFGADCSGNLVARLTPDLSGVVASACLPGPWLQALAVDPAGNAYLLHNADNDTFVTKVRLNQPPDCSAAFASPVALWPPDGRLVPVMIRNVIDPDGDPVTLTVTVVRQDEPLSKPGAADATGIGTSTAQLRSDRDGSGDGRVYRLSFTAADPQGTSCTGAVAVCVPHDQGRGRACGDGGALFDSTGSGQ